MISPRSCGAAWRGRYEHSHRKRRAAGVVGIHIIGAPRVTDRAILIWIHQRLVKVHGESVYVDYMHKLREVIGGMPKDKRTNTGYVTMLSNEVQDEIERGEPGTMDEARKQRLKGLLDVMPAEWAARWCEGGGICACLGCANNSGGLRKEGFSKAEWEEVRVPPLKSTP